MDLLDDNYTYFINHTAVRGSCLDHRPQIDDLTQFCIWHGLVHKTIQDALIL